MTSASKENGDSAGSTDIAIIGMAGRFPGARNVREFWANLTAGVESIRPLSEEDLLRAGVPRSEFEQPHYVRACPVLDAIDRFDASFFGISPRDASVMDPAHRLFLEVAWQALEDSGNTGLPRESRVGVWASSGAPQYWMNNVRSHQDIARAMGEFLVRHTANDMNFLATRVSYELDLRGPSINVQTACSSGLVAVHLAAQSLLAHECDMALVGGSTIVLPMGRGYHWQEGEILSPDGHCRPFDHRSAGTVFGSGSACVVLKRLEDALDHGDTIVAIVKGSAVNNDGAVKVGYLAPGVDGQAAVIGDALRKAGVAARTISYVEGHGTGTTVGDPIELTALQQAFEAETTDRGFCGIGSVKSNIGHLGEAAGIASLIKVALALQHRQLPPTIGYEAPNPRFPLAESPFRVVSALEPWRGEEPLRAGITALGAGGTNCHLVLEEPPPPLPGEGGRDRQLLVLSARTPAALQAMAKNLADHLERHPNIDLADVAYTLAHGRRPLSHRRALVVRDREDAIAVLRGAEANRSGVAVADTTDPGVVFLFPGGGAQYPGMTADLYAREPAFRQALDECLQIAESECDPGLRRHLFATGSDVQASVQALQRPSLTLPCLFAVEYALARLFVSYGMRPVAFVGHSMGEYVAACLAGVFSLRDGIRLVTLRGRLFERTAPGRMIGVSLAEAELNAMLPAGLAIAVVNAPGMCVASGLREQVEALGLQLTERGVDWTPIHIDVAAHSPLLEPILPDFRAFCRTIQFRAPIVPIASNWTGRWLTATEAQDPEYWVEHLRGTVRFSDCVETVLEGGPRVFVEIGPGRTLTTLVGAQRTKVRHVVNSVRHPKEPGDDVEYALMTLGRAYAGGAAIDWTAFYDGQLRNRVPLPPYPFDGPSYWLDAKALTELGTAEPTKRPNVDDWFATVAFVPKPRVPASKPIQASRWLLFGSDASFLRLVGQRLRSAGADDVQLVQHGSRSQLLGDGSFELELGAGDQYRALFERLIAAGRVPEHIVMVLDMEAATPVADPAFLVPARLMQVIAATLDSAAVTVVTHNAYAVGSEPLRPEMRLAVGPVLVTGRELPDLRVRLVDLDVEDRSVSARGIRAEQLARELATGAAEPVVVLRPPRRFVPELRPILLPPVPAAPAWLADGDVVLITGGLGGIGRALAEHLASQRRIKLALLSREALPARDQRIAFLQRDDLPARTRDRVRWLEQLEARGAIVEVVHGDVADRDALRRALVDVRRLLGPITVVLHAAGLMQDEPLLAKGEATMQRVLAPKVQGTRNLDALVTEELKAFVMMSSVASLLGLPGQVDYTAANAFLDAFAEHRQRSRPGRTVVVNWNAWRDVGMVLGVGGVAPVLPLPEGRTAHPWLAATEPIPGGRRFLTDFRLDANWLVAEHRTTNGDALIPGTGFVELARAAFLATIGDAVGGLVSLPHVPIELRAVTFQVPFLVAPEGSNRLAIEVRGNSDVASVTMRSGDAVTHLTAEVQRCAVVPIRVDLAALKARCPRQVGTRDGFLDQEFMRFGPRWRNLVDVRFGNGEAVLELRLDAAFAADLPGLAYHPALLDMATGGAQALIPGFRPAEHFLVPFGYDRIRISRPVSAQCTSHVRLCPGATPELAAFDVRVYDEFGDECIEVLGFTMKRVDSRVSMASRSPATNAAPSPSKAMADLLREAIATEEGLQAFDRVMEQQEVVQVVASSVDVDVWRRKLDREAQVSDADGDGHGGFARPALSSDFVAPEAGLESEVAVVWSKLLGVAEVGANDNFFELGGSSLTAARFFARIKTDYGTSMPLSSLFQAPTIRLIAVALQELGARPLSVPDDQKHLGATGQNGLAVAAEGGSAPRIQPPLLIRPGSGDQPVFFVHDGLGEVLLYRTLALRLDSRYPVYGLEPETSKGRILNTSIVAMAQAKVERLRTVQPHGPYLLAGLCAGGVVAFEIARQLEDAGESVRFVGLIDAAAVGASVKRFLAAQKRWESFRSVFRHRAGQSRLAHLATLAPALARKVKNLVSYKVSSRLDRARVKRQVAAMDKQVEPVADLTFLKIYENAHREHLPQGTFSSGMVTLFRATHGNGNVDDVPFREIYAEEALGWRSLVGGRLEVLDVPGGHTSVLQEPNVAVLAAELQARIDAAMRS